MNLFESLRDAVHSWARGAPTACITLEPGESASYVLPSELEEQIRRFKAEGRAVTFHQTERRRIGREGFAATLVILIDGVPFVGMEVTWLGDSELEWTPGE